MTEQALTAAERRAEALRASRAATKAANEEAIRKAMQTLERAGKPITAKTVAKEAGVVRQTVYNSRFIDEIKQLTDSTAGRKKKAATTQASHAGLSRRLEDALAEIGRLRAENSALKVENSQLLEQLQR